MSDNTTCPYCGKVCKSTGGLRQHISKSSECNYQQRLQVIATASVPFPPNPEAQHTQIHSQLTTGTRRSMRLQIRDQDATGSVRFSTESVDGPPSDQEALVPDPTDDGIDADGNRPISNRPNAYLSVPPACLCRNVPGTGLCGYKKHLFNVAFVFH